MTGTKMTLDEIYTPIENKLLSVQKVIEKELKTIMNDPRSKGINDGFVEQISSHLFRKPGKKLRPALVLLSAGMAGSNDGERDEALIEFGAAVELIHSATLIHDDIIDKSDVRRETSTLNSRFGSTVAVLTGDILYARFFSLLTNLPDIDPGLKLRLFDIFSRLTLNMCLGEIFQHEIIQRRFNPDETEYIRVLENKTAYLMSACCECGALLNGSDEKEAEILARFGLNFGLAYQLIDDLVDGDSPMDGKMDLLSRAESSISDAKTCLEAFTKSESRVYLEMLCEFVIRQNAT
jgi:geranylgeranyl pyrophosphate synthase